MGKRQIIIKASDLKPEIVGEEVNIEMNDGRIWHGYVTSLAAEELMLKDTRQKEHKLKRAEIKRVFAERVTEY